MGQQQIRAGRAEQTLVTVTWSAVGRALEIGTPRPVAGFDLAFARLRAWAMVAVCGQLPVLLGLLWLLSPQSFPVRDHPLLWQVTVAGFLALTAWTFWRRDRVGDLEFLALVLAAMGLAVLFVAGNQRTGSYVSGEIGLMGNTIMATVFCARRWQVAIEVLVALTTTAWLIGQRLGTTGEAPAALIIELATLLIVAVVVRLLREVALGALIRADRGEVTDPLTGLANRRGLERSGQQSWQQRAQAHEPIGLLVVDIDHFKKVNDTLGHAAGDDLIRQVTAMMSACLRQNDVAVRLGGEEFLILAQAPLGQASAIAERLRTAIEEKLAPVTVSIGVHETFPDPADELPVALWNAIDVADQALYEAKHSGRNRVVTSPARSS